MAFGVAVLDVVEAGRIGLPDLDARAGHGFAAGPAHDGPFTVWVKNVRTGEIAVLVGESEVVHHDKALATKLAQIAARA